MPLTIIANTPLIAERRLTVVSGFDDRHRRGLAELAARRNALVAAMSSTLLVVHAEPGGQVERLVGAAAEEGMPVFVMLPERVETLVDARARPATVAAIRSTFAR